MWVEVNLMNLYNKKENRRQSGFTLIELMVGLTIGMLATVVIMQVLSVFEAQKRTTTGAADAQTNGGIALYTITRDLQMAGWGMHPVGDPLATTASATAFSPLSCGTLTVDGAAGIDPGVLFPVMIADGGAASDSITIRYGDSMKGGFPSTITIPAGNPVTVSNNLGCQVNDRALLVAIDTSTNPISQPCALTNVTGITGTTQITLANTTLATPDVHLACLGTWIERTYSVSSVNNVNTMLQNGVANVADVVNIQAQYGISNTPSSNQVVQWVDASGAWVAPSVDNRKLIKAIRIAVIARNSKKEPVNVTDACSSTTTAAPTGLCAWDATDANPQIASPAPAITLNNDPDGTSWRHYRYRVFETIIPLRNIIWSRSTL
jgi:type IV pilus assembly protein PilW